MVPRNYEENKPLGNWVGLMRVYYNGPEKKENPFWKNRFAKLEAVGFVWEGRFSAIEYAWQERFKELCEYKETHGDCRVPSDYRLSRQLGSWVP
mmetsp:Transcript_6282/g.14823  ORF Transcript_6282/g.14823 Transcript_6282/m.14823 type:complete len:94 (+) Transcript_6282:412-693(+)